MTLFLCICLFTFGQINEKHNAIRPTDEIIKQQVEYKDLGRSGENVVWNFSKLNFVKSEYTLNYYPVSLIDDSIYIMGRDTIPKIGIKENELIIGVEHRTMYYYRIKNNNLYCLGHENSVTLMHHKEPLLVMPYSFNFGQSAKKDYSSEGLYSSQEPLKANGEITIEADAFGIMILPSGDTLSHVMRIKSIQTVNEADSARLLENNPLKMEVESYKWYAKGYRYPVFETIKSYDLRDTLRTENFSVAFFYPPQEHYYLWDDSENLAVMDSLWSEKNKGQITENNNPNQDLTEGNKFNYNFFPNPVVNDLNVEYLLKENSQISITLFDMNGKIANSIPTQTQKAGLYTENIDCSSLTDGNYILQINVDGEIISNKIIKK